LGKKTGFVKNNSSVEALRLKEIQRCKGLKKEKI